ncbi:nucleotidyltransferase domain-containing protein [Thermosulfurimonas marina]|uniref:Nucleotidyltransferase domain-containing protein n=1 Tax=Thermosulfurimonas marina TaxID=2047767 RepID=A0A6H1WT68_9BACT|nr:nucleotidyltransferase domain-containing protein [Thermosulfurimonas marina]QJA06349.1 nucleotidyltransferase domain-containing protein [Thermosulfurimonas marina]
MELLYRWQSKEKARREALRQKVLSRTQRALGELYSRIPFRRAFIFGSLVRPGAFGDHSDVDIALEGLPPERFWEAVALLSEILEREVDVLPLEEARFRKKIEKEGILWKRP